MRFSIDVRPQIQEHEGMKITVSLDTYKALTQLLEHEEDTYDAVVWRLLGNSNKQTPSQKSSSQENELYTRTPDTDSTTAAAPTTTSSNPSESSATPNTSQTDNTHTANNTTNTPTGTPPPAAMTATTAVAPTSVTSATAVNPTNADAIKTETQPNEDDNATHYFEYGVKLLIGTQLRRRYKGKEYVATVHAKGLKLDGQNYASLSEAAGAITEYEMNGWAFWQYQDPKNGKWEPVARLRKTTSTAEH